MTDLPLYFKRQQRFQDEVFTRISVLSDESCITAAELYCHKSCVSEPYEIKFKKSTGDKVASKQPKKGDIFGNYITFIKPIIENGNTISLSELRDTLNQNKNIIFNNAEKNYLLLYILATVLNCVIHSKNMNLRLYFLHKQTFRMLLTNLDHLMHNI